MASKTVFTLIVGFFLGILLSPISLWLLLSDTVPDRPLLFCAKTGLYAIQLKPFRNLSFPATLFPRNSSKRLTTYKLPNLSQDKTTLHIAILTSSNSRSLALYESWGKNAVADFDIRFYKFRTRPTSNRYKKIPLNFNVMKWNEHNVNESHKVWRLLEHLCNDPRNIRNFKFVLLARDNVYIQTDKLKEFLSALNPSLPLFIGHPSTINSHNCVINAGIVLSQESLQLICPNIDKCAEETAPHINEDEHFGSCINSIAKIQCSNGPKDTGLHYAGRSIDQTLNNGILSNVITLHTIRTMHQFYFVHQMVTEFQVKEFLKQTSKLTQNLQQFQDTVSSLNTSFRAGSWWALNKMAHTNPKSHYNLIIWKYFNASCLFQVNEKLTVSNLQEQVKSGINSALQIAIEGITAQEGAVTPPYILHDGFLSTAESTGMEFVLHMSVKRKSNKFFQNYTAFVNLPFQRPGTSVYYKFGESLQKKRVHFIVPVSRYDNPVLFLEMFETELLQHNASVCLHFVFFYHDALMLTKLAQIKRIYSFSDIHQHEITDKPYSHSYAFNYIASNLTNDQLMVFLDINFYVTMKFLDHCRILAIQGKQIYSPVHFSFYKPDLVKKFGKLSRHIDVDSGYFNQYNYQVVALYKSDYIKIGGYKHCNKVKDDICILKNILNSNIYLFRGVEPYITRLYKHRVCSNLKGVSKSHCLNSIADSIGSKKVLGSFIINKSLL